MSTLRLSRYTTNEYYFEVHTPYGILLDNGYPVCGDFSPNDLVELVAEYPSIDYVVVGAPDRVNRISDARTTSNAHPSYQEYNVLKDACSAAGVEFNSTLG